MPIKLIVTDMDDTLLTSRGTILPRTQRTILRARELGAHVVLASGRMTRAMNAYVDQLGVTDPIIAYNGAQVVNPVTWNVMSRIEIPAELSRAVAEMAEEMGVHAQGYWNDEYYYAQDNAFSDLYASAVGVTGKSLGIPLSRGIVQDNTKMLLVDEPARIAELAPIFARTFGDQLDCAISRPNYLECTNRLANKGNALQLILRQLDIRPDEIVAFGDGQNDLTMLRMAGLRFAPANAHEDIRSEAGRVCPSNDDEGVASVLEELMDQGMIIGR